MNTKFKFIPLSFHWCAIHPQPIGVVYFIGGAFFGTFPNFFYRYLLQEVFEQGYTIVAIPYRFTFDHWSVAINIFKDLEEVRKSLYQEALSLNYTTNIGIYLESPIAQNSDYLWIGHSLGCKYIQLLEILTELDSPDLEDLKKSPILRQCGIQEQAKNIRKSLDGITLAEVSLKNQPSIFLAPVIAGIQNAIPIPFLAKLLQYFGLDVRPSVKETKCLISQSSYFQILDIIAFSKDKQASKTVEWFKHIFEAKKRLNALIFLADRIHLAPLGYQDGDREVAKTVIYALEKSKNETINGFVSIEVRS